MSAMSELDLERQELEDLPFELLLAKFSEYSSLQARGVRDEILLTLIENELDRRECQGRG